MKARQTRSFLAAYLPLVMVVLVATRTRVRRVSQLLDPQLRSPMFGSSWLARGVKALALALLLLVGACQRTGAVAPPHSARSVRVRVLNHTGSPCASAMIWLKRGGEDCVPTGPESYLDQVETDANGECVLDMRPLDDEGLPSGARRVVTGFHERACVEATVPEMTRRRVIDLQLEEPCGRLDVFVERERETAGGVFAASVVEDPDDLGYVPVHYENGDAITFFGVPTGRAVHVQVWEIDPRTWDWHEIQRRKIDTPSLDGWRESVVVR